MRTGIVAPGLDAADQLNDLLLAMKDHPQADTMIVYTDNCLSDTITRDMPFQLIPPQRSSLLSRRWWLDVKLPAALKRNPPEVLLNLTGEISFTTNIPQLLFINDLERLHRPNRLPGSRQLFSKFYFPRYLQRAKAVIVPSHHIRQELVAGFKIASQKIHVLPPVVNPAYTGTTWEQQERIKQSYTDGRDFFLSSYQPYPPDHSIRLLKAFSQFKKWQRSDVKLVITGVVAEEMFIRKLQTFKYRDDVILVNELSIESKAALMAACYAFIHAPVYETGGWQFIAAMKSATAVIGSNLPGLREVGGDAVLYTQPGNEDMLASQMISLYKDETLRARLARAGKQRSEMYDAVSTAGNLWTLVREMKPSR